VGAAVAVIVAKEQKIVELFRRAGAVEPGSAVTPAGIGVPDMMAFRRLCQHDVLREAAPGTFYLDEQGWGELRGRRRRLGFMLLFAVLVGALVLWLKRSP